MSSTNENDGTLIPNEGTNTGSENNDSNTGSENSGENKSYVLIILPEWYIIN